MGTQIAPAGRFVVSTLCSAVKILSSLCLFWTLTFLINLLTSHYEHSQVGETQPVFAAWALSPEIADGEAIVFFLRLHFPCEHVSRKQSESSPHAASFGGLCSLLACYSWNNRTRGKRNLAASSGRFYFVCF